MGELWGKINCTNMAAGTPYNAPWWGWWGSSRKVSERYLLHVAAQSNIHQIFLMRLQFSHSVMSDSLRSHEPQHGRPPCPSPTPPVHPNPLSRWCHPTISSSVVPFSSCPQSFPASESFQMSQLFAWGGQSTAVSALASFLPMNTQDWSLGWTGWISLQSKGLSRVFSNTTVQKHQFFSTQLSLYSNSHNFRRCNKFVLTSRVVWS